jgi:hypothetical protein
MPSACISQDAPSDFDSASLNSWLVKYHFCSFGPPTALKYSSADLRLMYMSGRRYRVQQFLEAGHLAGANQTLGLCAKIGWS